MNHSNKKLPRYSTEFTLNSEKMLFVLTLLLWSQRILVPYMRAFFMRLPYIGLMADSLISLTYIVLIISALPEILRRIRFSDILFGLATITVYLLNYVLYPENSKYLTKYAADFLLYTMPLYYIGVSMDFERTYPWICRISVLTIFAFTFYELFMNEAMTEVQSVYEGDMWAAYNLLPHASVVTIKVLKKPRVVDVVAAILGVLMLFAMGSRGPIICLAVVTAAFLCVFKRFKRAALAKISIVIVVLMLILFFDEIMRMLYTFSSEAGLSVRIFEKYFSGDMTTSLSRNVIKEVLLNLIQRNPVAGYGIFADRQMIGTYAHHLAIELWLHFGVLLGSVLLLSLVILIIRAIRCAGATGVEISLLLPMIGVAVIKLFLSGSYLNEMYLFWLIGFCVSVVRRSANRP